MIMTVEHVSFFIQMTDKQNSEYDRQETVFNGLLFLYYYVVDTTRQNGRAAI